MLIIRFNVKLISVEVDLIIKVKIFKKNLMIILKLLNIGSVKGDFCKVINK